MARTLSSTRLSWHWHPFSAFTIETLYAVLRLRAEVFVVEQTCPYQDLDGKDARAWHLLGRAPESGALWAYARVFAPGVYAAEMAIGRVITAPAARGQGLGRPLMREAIRRGFETFGAGPCRVEAQAHLKGYYGSLGFAQVGEIYDEDGIPHMSMIRPEPEGA